MPTVRIAGDDNISAGRDVYIQRAQDTANKLSITDHFDLLDRKFRDTISTTGEIQKGQELTEYSSDALFTSMVNIGIPVSIAIDVPESIIPLLRLRIEQEGEEFRLSTSDIKAAVLQYLSGLQYTDPAVNSDEIATWSSAYVRRYGSSSRFLQIIDKSDEHDLNYDYVKDIFLPHLLGNIIGTGGGEDVVVRFPDVFAPRSIGRMANEVIRIANSLNLYSIRYKTLYWLIMDTMLQPPHPWIVTQATIESVTNYNMDRARSHYNLVADQVYDHYGEYLFPSVRECAVHLCAAILSRNGCLLGVGSRYGISELHRLVRIRTKNNNIPLWNYCEFNNIEEKLNSTGKTLKSFHAFLDRLQSDLLVHPSTVQKFLKIFGKCSALLEITFALVGYSPGFKYSGRDEREWINSL